MSNEPKMPTVETTQATTGKKVRILMIGAGNIANTHLDAYKSVPQAEIVGICDIDKTRLDITCNQFGIAEELRYTDLDTMLAEKAKDADAADVCVWNCSHASCTIAALNAGLNVLCEKPMAFNTEQAIAMKEAADKNGKLLMIGFCTRFSNINKIAMDFVENGFLGQPYYAKATYLRRHGSPGGWFADKSRSGGGPVIDLGVHVIDNARVLMGSPKPVSVYATTSNLIGNRANLKTDVEWKPYGAKDSDPFTVEDFGSALIRFDNGAVMLLETSYALNGESVTKREIYGDKGGIYLGDKLKLYTELNGYLADVTPDTSCLKGGNNNIFTAEIRHFVDCITNGTPCRATAEDGILVMKILDAIYESAATGHEVIIK